MIAVEARTNLVISAGNPEHGIDNAAVIKSRLVDSYAAEAPYDCILVEIEVEFIPERYCNSWVQRASWLQFTGHNHRQWCC